MTVEQAETMLAAAGVVWDETASDYVFHPERVTMPPMWAAYTVAAIMLGFRPGELAGLQWRFIDFGVATASMRHAIKVGAGGRLVLAELKTKQSKRTLGMHPAVAAVLKWWRAAQAEDRLALGAAYDASLALVFADRVGRPLRRGTIRPAFNRECLKLIGETFQLRETRHTFVSLLSHRGTSIEAISAAVGHKNSEITRKVYLHVLGDVVTTTATDWSRRTQTA